MVRWRSATNASRRLFSARRKDICFSRDRRAPDIMRVSAGSVAGSSSLLGASAPSNGDRSPSAST